MQNCTEPRTLESNASARWKILKRAVLAAAGTGGRVQTEPAAVQASVRSFASFGLFEVTELREKEKEEVGLATLSSSKGDTAERVWMKYSYRSKEGDQLSCVDGEEENTSGDIALSVLISHLSQRTTQSLQAMMGFNNTGNVCVWPSEEVLAHFCLQSRRQFCGKSVCELGGGMTCLAGLSLALTGSPSRVVLTDGNPTSVENIRCIVAANSAALAGLENTRVTADVLLWSDQDCRGDEPFDFVICADCLFFVDLHDSLCQMIGRLLSPGGRAYLLNPRRGGTLEQFVEVAERTFVVSRCDTYSRWVWQKHRAAMETDRYKSDLHYPVLLVLQHRT